MRNNFLYVFCAEMTTLENRNYDVFLQLYKSLMQ